MLNGGIRNIALLLTYLLRRVSLNTSDIGALTITYTILVVPYCNASVNLI